MNAHSQPPHRWRLPAALAAAVLAGPLVSTAGGPAQAADGDQSALNEFRLDDSMLEAAGFGTQVVTLISGASYEVTTSLTDPITVVPTQASLDREAQTGESVPMVRAVEPPGEPSVLNAVPRNATALVESGQVDPSLFDLARLREHRSSTPVTVYYKELSSAEENAEAADGLPGSQYVAGSAAEDRATVAVTAGSGAAFWNAVTQPRSFDPNSPEGWLYEANPAAVPLELAAGIAGLTLDGAPLAVEIQPTHDVTATDRLAIRVHGTSDRSLWPSPWSAQVPGSSVLIGVTGPLAADLEQPVSAFCEDAECRVVQYVYQVPPATYWHGYYIHRDRRQNMSWQTNTTEPEVTVNGDMTLDIHIDDRIRADLNTPRTSELRYLSKTEARTLPNGTVVSNLSWSCGSISFCSEGHYFVPSQTQVQTGSFNAIYTDNRLEPQVDIELEGGGGTQTLRGKYYHDSNSGDSYPGPDIHYLSGHDETLEVVDVGMGSEADFAKVDATGRLVLMAPDPAIMDDQRPGEFFLEQMQRAERHGAVGVLGDPTCPWRTWVHEGESRWSPCKVPMDIEWWPEVPALPEVPLVTLGMDSAAQLRERLQRGGPVGVTVDSPVDQSSYYYTKAWHFAGGIPQHIDLDTSHDNLMIRHPQLHEAAPQDEATAFTSAYVSGMNIVAGSGVGWVVGADNRSFDEYISVDADIIRNRSLSARGSEELKFNVIAGGVFHTGSESREEAFNQGPRSIGPAIPTPFRPDNRPLITCDFCRVGDVLYPFTGFNEASEPHHTPNGSGDAGILPNAVLKDAAGNEIPQTVRGGFIPVYELPSETQKYTLSSWFPQGSRFSWTFTSGTAPEDNRPVGTTCLAVSYFGGSSCGEALPLIYLRYGDAPVDLDNTAAAGSRHTIEVTGYHHYQDGPTVDDLSTQVSFDGGETWRDAQMRHIRTSPRDDAWGQKWSATFTVPDLADTNGYVSLRTKAGDVAGNATDQTLVNAYQLR